jgi:hypothetical protein
VSAIVLRIPVLARQDLNPTTLLSAKTPIEQWIMIQHQLSMTIKNHPLMMYPLLCETTSQGLLFIINISFDSTSSSLPQLKQSTASLGPIQFQRK